MDIIDLSLSSLLMGGLLLLAPILVMSFFKLGLSKSLVISALRMSVQLVLIGVFLKYLFEWNNAWINILWFLLMILVATFTIGGRSKLNMKIFFAPLLVSFVVVNISILLYFNFFIVKIDGSVFDARYVITIGGMVLGNSLQANIIGLGSFYQSAKKEENLYLYKLSLGATKFEALRPFLKNSFISAINPTIASMATMGIVSLPGMMTGQILGGSLPVVAIKYQIVIMIGIIANTVLCLISALLLSYNRAFSHTGKLKNDITTG